MKLFNSFFNNSKKMVMALLCIIYVATVQSSYAQSCSGILAAPVTINGVTVTRTANPPGSGSAPFTDLSSSTISCSGAGFITGYTRGGSGNGVNNGQYTMLVFNFSCPVTSFEFFVGNLPRYGDVTVTSENIDPFEAGFLSSLCTFGNVQLTGSGVAGFSGATAPHPVSGGRFKYNTTSGFTTAYVTLSGFEFALNQGAIDFGLCGSSIVKAACVPGTAPTLSATTKANTCPATTVNLTTITATNLPAGTTLTWHTGTPATTANKVTGTAQAAGTYYASFFDANCGCYSNTRAVTATVSACVSCNAGSVAPVPR